MHKWEAPEPLMERAPVSLGDSATIYSHVYLIFDICRFVPNISYDNPPLSCLRGERACMAPTPYQRTLLSFFVIRR